MQDDNGCWNCRHFLYEDTDGYGWCNSELGKVAYCGDDPCKLWKERE